MDISLWVAIVGAIASVAAVLITNRFTARSAQSAQRRTAEIERTKVDAEAYARARESYESALATQKKQLEQLQRETAEDRGEYRTAINELKVRIRELEAAHRYDQMRLREFVVWARHVVALMREHGVEYPLPPDDPDRDL